MKPKRSKSSTASLSFFSSNRPILRHADDSLARILHGRERVAPRGYAPPDALEERAGAAAVGDQ
jgi:hypothetical protein